MNDLVTDAIEALFNRRRVLSAMALSGTAMACSGVLAAAACAQYPLQPALRSSSFPNFRDAVIHWGTVGGTLIVDQDHVESQPITMNCVAGRSYHLTSEGRRTIAYAGPHYHWLFCLNSKGATPFIVDGNLTFDGRNRCNIPFFARFEDVGGAQRRDFCVSGLVARNARMAKGVSPIDGSPNNAYGATGMLFMGGFNHLDLRNISALDVTRDAGAGRSGSQGCVGIGVVAALGTTRSAKHVTVEDFRVANINSDDLPGSPERTDMDGVLVFQSAEADGSRPLIQRGEVTEAAGRAIKVFAPGGGGTTRNVIVRRSVHGNTGGSNDVAHQHGDGLIEGITFYYAGNAHSQPTIPIGMSSGSRRPAAFPFQAGIVRNVRIADTTGRDKRAIFTIYYSEVDGSPRSYVLEQVSDSGRALYLVMPGGLGSYGPAEMVLDDIEVDLTVGLVATDDRSQSLQVTARGLQNRNRHTVPFKVFYDGRPAPPQYGGIWRPDASVRGING